MGKMTENELKALVQSEHHAALGFMSDELANQRQKSMDYYLGEPFGNEQEGRSKVVSTDVADTIEWILPSLLKIFMAGDEVVRFDPQQPEDEQAAKQATEYINFVFNRDNAGFLILYSMFKDGLLQKNGISKVWWDTRKDTKSQKIPGLTEDLYLVMRQDLEDDDWEVETEKDDETGLHTLTARKEIEEGRVVIHPVPPEEFLIQRRAKSIEEASFVAHRVRRTASDLIADGYDRELVERLPTSPDGDLWEEQQTRRKGVDADTADIDATMNEAMRPIWVTEAYVRADWDDDGIAELRKIVYCGDGGFELLENEAWDGPAPFVSVTPIIMPHRFYGRSISELVEDLQLIKSTVLRQILDNMYRLNNGRYAVSEKVELQDLLTTTPGGIVRLKDGVPAEGHILPLPTPAIIGEAFPLLEYIDTVKENRTGVTRYNQGLDANSLNKTASGINQIMTAAQSRIELIARIFAETGVKELFKKILYLVRSNQDQSRIIRLRNQWVEMSPMMWPDEFDVTISVGLGTGNRDMQAMHLNQIAQAQIAAVQLQGGAQGPLVTLENLYNTGNRLAQALGFKEEGLFFTDPSQKKMQPQQPKPDPKMLELQQKGQIEQAKLQMEMQKTQAELALEREKMQAELRLKAADTAANQQLQRDKAAGDMMAKREIAAMSAKPPVSVALGSEEMTAPIVELFKSQSQQIQAFMQQQAQRDAKQDGIIQSLITAIAAPRTKQISGKLPSGQTFQAVVSEGQQ